MSPVVLCTVFFLSYQFLVFFDPDFPCRVCIQQFTLLQDLDRSVRESERSAAQLGERFAAADEAATKLGTLQRTLFDLQASQVPLELARDKLQRENEALTSQNAWLDGELASKAEELRRVKQEAAKEVASLRSVNDETTAKLAETEATLARVRAESERRALAVEAASAALRDEQQKGAEACRALETTVSAEQRAARLATEVD
jgi:chromosome segregation ATPase